MGRFAVELERYATSTITTVTQEPAARLLEILSSAKVLAKEYRELTGRPLGVTGEVAEYEAARLLGLELANARQAGFDAIRRSPDGETKLQIKGRCLRDRSRGGRLGRIELAHEWDAVLMVLLDEDLEAVAIYEAKRVAIKDALESPGSKSRNERGALAVSKFRAIGKLVWSRDPVA